MIIKSLSLKNYRNYENLKLDFSNGINIFYGNNAQGKTNVLEAIYVAGTTKSHKSSKDREMIRMGTKEAHIKMYVTKKEISHRIDIHLKKSGSKGVAIDGVPTRKSSDLIGLCNIIFFSPEDLNIIKNGPGERRRFINMELCQMDKMYLYYLTKYNKILNQRNNLLKQISFDENLMDTLEIWDLQLLENGKQIITLRKKFINQLNEIMKNIHYKLSGGKEQIEISYEPNIEAAYFEEKLFLSRDKDLFQGTTCVGPHRDDINFIVNGIDIRKYGSQGQQRTTALSLKLAEIEIVKDIVGETPILLLDDVLSELDRKRQNYLLENIKGIQTIITCTGLEEFIENKMNINRTFEIINGTQNGGYHE